MSSNKGSFEMNEMMLQAMRLTRANKLLEATAVLQRMLQGETKLGMTISPTDEVALTDTKPIIDVKAEAIDETDRQRFDATTITQPRDLRALFDLTGRVKLHPGSRLRGWMPSRAPSLEIVPTGGKFVEAIYSNPAGSRTYKLYIPSRYQGQALPLVVMLHGGTQTPDDFAAGTRMNILAEEQTCLVVYPAQPSHANPAKCWNWFRPNDQRRDQGEPSLIAGITQQVMRDYVVDPQRVYVGGLSAGGAAAAIMGATYPDLYSAIGVHSGLPSGAADNLPSAFAAMRGALEHSSDWNNISVAGGAPAMPTIVFHGDRDTIVHHRNGDRVIAQSMTTATWQKNEKRGQVPGGHAYTCTIHTDASGRAVLEQWCIHGAGHAWSGGSPGGSYTDPLGPDVSREMLRFFLNHRGGSLPGRDRGHDMAPCACKPVRY
jgi:poly(hydroxyalkanoate) depolymerase family esterase